MNIIEALKDRSLLGASPVFADLTTWRPWLVFLSAVSSSYEYSIFLDTNKVGATSCELTTPSYAGGFSCPFGLEPNDLSGFILTGLTCTELETEIGTEWTLIWDEGLGTETVVGIDFGTINFNCDDEDGVTEWPSVFPSITNPPDGETGVGSNTSIVWEWPVSPVLDEVAVFLLQRPNGDRRDSGWLPHPPPPTSWTPASPLGPWDWKAVVVNANSDIRTVPTGLTITGHNWPLTVGGGWSDAVSMDVSDFTVAPAVPSLSPVGIALLGGLVFTIAVSGLALQRRRRAE